MIDEPPAIEALAAPDDAVQGEAPLPPLDSSALPEEVKADGTLVIDLMPLAPTPQRCADEEPEPDPFYPVIVVCRQMEADPRLGPNQGPDVDDLLFGSAVPRARLKLSETAEAQANTIKKSVGGFDADGGEVRVKIEF
ncbi:MAG: hypothetical protein AAFY47_08880 [Pseudomonadota bacterium]